MFLPAHAAVGGFEKRTPPATLPRTGTRGTNRLPRCTGWPQRICSVRSCSPGAEKTVPGAAGTSDTLSISLSSGTLSVEALVDFSNPRNYSGVSQRERIPPPPMQIQWMPVVANEKKQQKKNITCLRTASKQQYDPVLSVFLRQTGLLRCPDTWMTSHGYRRLPLCRRWVELELENVTIELR